MVFLEIAMIIIGLAAVIISFRVTDKKEENANANGQSLIEKEGEQIESIKKELSEKANQIVENTDEKLSALSNEKIMGMSEYSDQVIDKIEKNHAEVVFLYDMLNEKQDEMKQLVQDIDSLKAEIHNEAAKGYQSIKEQEKQLNQIKKDLEIESLKQDHTEKQSNMLQKEDNWVDSEQLDEEFQALLGETDALENEEMEDLSAASVFDQEIAKIEEEEAKNTPKDVYRPLKEQEKAENHNDEIIHLYKNGRSILEISKMLSLGQGEVKFVIDLYEAKAR